MEATSDEGDTRALCNSLVKRYRKMLVKFDPPLGELYWAIDKQKPQDYYSFGIISEPKDSQKT